MFLRILTVAALVALMTVVALADPAPESRRITIVDGDGDEHVITFSGSAIEVVSEADGEQSVHAFNLAGLEPILDGALDEAMADLDDAMAELEDLDLSISVDGDMVVVESGETVHAVNVRFLSETVGEFLGEMMADVDGGLHLELDGDVDGDRDEHDDRDSLDRETEELRSEVRALKQELKQLTEELARR